MQPFRTARDLLATIPGIGQLAAAAVISEIGADVRAYFPNAAHLASWAGICPGNHESAGKHRPGKRRHGNQHLAARPGRGRLVSRPARGLPPVPLPPARHEIRRLPQHLREEQGDHRRRPRHPHHRLARPGHRHPLRRTRRRLLRPAAWTPNAKPAASSPSSKPSDTRSPWTPPSDPSRPAADGTNRRRLLTRARLGTIHVSGQHGRPSKSLTLDQAIAATTAASTLPVMELRPGLKDALLGLLAELMHAYIVLSLLTGIRTEEARALHWTHVNLDGDPAASPPVPPHIAVWRSVRIHGDTKTERSRRTLALPTAAVHALRAWSDSQAGERLAAGDGWQHTGLVFTRHHRAALDAGNVRKMFKRICAEAGIGDAWTPRELRTSFVSLMSHQGVSIEEIARLVGHATTRTTETVYRHELRPVITHRRRNHGRALHPKLDPGGLLTARRSMSSIRAVTVAMMLLRPLCFPSSWLQNGHVMSMQPVPWPDPDPVVAAAIGAMYGSRKTEPPLAVTVRDRLGEWLRDEEFAGAFGVRGTAGLAAVAAGAGHGAAAGGEPDRPDGRGGGPDPAGLEVPARPARWMTRGSTTRCWRSSGAKVADAGLEQVVLDALLERLAADGLVKAGGKQRTDSTHVVAAVAALNRLELAGESVRAAVEALTAAHPGWVAQLP